MKKYLSLLLFSTLLTVVLAFNPTSIKAAEQGKVDLNDLSELANDENVTFTEVSYEEMINDIAKSNGISKEAAKFLHPNQTNAIRPMTFNPITPQSTSIHKITIRQEVAAKYRPALQIFVWTYNSGSFTSFNKIEAVGLDRKDVSLNTSKHFSGELKATIETSTRIWWYINGDFYNNGTTTISGTAEASGLVWKGSATVTQSENHFKYWNNSGKYLRYNY